MTEQAYRWIGKYSGTGVFGIKGSSREMLNKMKITVIGTLPGRRNIPIPGAGVRLWVIDTAYFKDVFHARMQIKDGDPGACYLHSDTDMDYAKQIVSEEKRRDKNGRYQWEHVRGENHYLDAEIYASCLVDPVCFGGLGIKPDHQKKAEPPPRKSREGGPAGKGWLDDRVRRSWKRW